MLSLLFTIALLGWFYLVTKFFYVREKARMSLVGDDYIFDYTVTVVLEGVDESTPGIEDELFRVGLYDALITFVDNYTILEVTRRAELKVDVEEQIMEQLEQTNLPIEDIIFDNLGLYLPEDK